MGHREFVDYQTEGRYGRGAVRITRGPDMVGSVKAVLGSITAVGLVAILMFGGYSEYRRRTNEGATSDWATSMAAKLRDPIHSLTFGEKFYPEVTVVAAGRTWYERLRMEQERPPVNIRRYPALGLPAGGESPVAGTTRLDNVIKNVIVRDDNPQDPSEVGDGWGSFFCRDAQGATWLGEPPGQDAVCAADSNYLLASRQ